MSSHQTPHAICISEWAVCCWYGKTQGAQRYLNLQLFLHLLDSRIGCLRQPLLALRVWRWHKIRRQMLYVKLSRKYVCPKHNKVLYTNLHRGIKFVFWLTFWFISYIEEKFSYIEEHISTWKKSFYANFFFIFAFNQLQIILLAPPWCKDSKNVIRFEIGPREGGEKIGQTNRQTDRQTNRRIFVNLNIDISWNSIDF